jgi:small subunit ribosomal protein S17
MAETEKTKIHKRVLKGKVVSTSMNKTAVIEVESKKRHPKYEKVIRRTKKYLIHDENNDLGIGDFVAVRETRPISKRKRFMLVEVLEKAK